ncbi:MAG: N-acetylmuramoyl-L-alanine amidase [Butyricimonas paravirosa]
MEIIENLLFGDNVKYLQCSKCKVKLSRVDTIVLHSTVGAGAISSALYLGRPDTSVSAHVVVGRDAEVFQLLPFDVKAWHAGKSFHAGRVNLNDCSIGIELDNAGGCNAWGTVIIRVSGEYSPDQVYTTEEEGGRDTGILLPRGSLRLRRRSVVC